MKLQRHSKARNTVSELQSINPISAEEAARAAGGKYLAIAAGAKAAGDLMTGLNEIKADEEYSAAKASYDSALVSIDQGLRDTPDQLDADGFPVDNTDDIINMERQARQKLSTDIRKNIKHGAARRRFDEMLGISKPQREESYFNLMFQKSAEILETKAHTVVDTMIERGQTELATTYANENINILGAKGHASVIKRIQTGRSTFRLDNAVLSQSISSSEMSVLVDAIEENKWPDGPMHLTGQQRYSYTIKLLGKMKDMEDAAGNAAEEAAEGIYLKLLPDTVRGNVPLEDLVPYRGMLGDRFDKLAGYAITAGNRPVKSHPGILEDYEWRATQASLGYSPDQMGMLNWSDKVDELIHAMSMDELISQSDYERMKTDLESSRTTLRGDPELHDMLNVEVQKITGHTIERSILGGATVDKNAGIAAERLILNYYREVKRLGPAEAKEGMRQWLKTNIPAYHVDLKDGVMKKYGFQPTMDENGRVDWLKLEYDMVENRIAAGKQQATNNANQEWDEEAQALAAETARIDFKVYRALTEAE